MKNLINELKKIKEKPAWKLVWILDKHYNKIPDKTAFQIIKYIIRKLNESLREKQKD